MIRAGKTRYGNAARPPGTCRREGAGRPEGCRAGSAPETLWIHRQTAAIREFSQRGYPEHALLGAAKVEGIHAPCPADSSARMPAAHQGGIAPHRRARAHPRPLCHVGEYRRHRDVRAYNRQYGTWFLAVMPTNLYGSNDNCDLETSHVIPSMIRKFHLAKLASQGNRAESRRTRKDKAPSRPISNASCTRSALGSGNPASAFGAPPPRAGSSCTATTWPMPACTS